MKSVTPRTGRRTSDFDLSLGCRLRAARRASGFTVVTLANHLGISDQQLQKYENGENRMTVRRLIDACRALDIDTCEFFQAEPDPSTTTSFIRTAEIKRLLRHYNAIQSVDVRLKLLEIIELFGKRYLAGR